MKKAQKAAEWKSCDCGCQGHHGQDLMISVGKNMRVAIYNSCPGKKDDVTGYYLSTTLSGREDLGFFDSFEKAKDIALEHFKQYVGTLNRAFRDLKKLK